MSEPTSKDPVIVVVQLSGGNDYMNTVVPHSNSLYRDYRPSVNISESDVSPVLTLSELFIPVSDRQCEIIEGEDEADSGRLLALKLREEKII